MRGGAGIWVVVALLVIGTFAGFRIGALYFDQEKLVNEVNAIGDSALTAPERYDTKARVVELASAYDIALDPDHVDVAMSGGREKISISFRYERTANLLLTSMTFPFTVEVERESKKAAGMIQAVQDSVENSNAASARKYKDAIEKATRNPPSSQEP